jgi:single-strand DNA-binding protein
MASFNKVILIGNLTRDPELKTSSTGTKVADLRLAISETWRDKNTGENREVVCYVDVAAWNRTAELCSQFLKKGSPILVEGRLQMDEWTTAQGEKRNKLRVRADVVKFLSTPKRDAPAGAGDSSVAAAAPGAPAARPVSAAPAADSAPAVSAAPADPAAQNDEDLPF